MARSTTAKAKEKYKPYSPPNGVLRWGDFLGERGKAHSVLREASPKMSCGRLGAILPSYR